MNPKAIDDMGMAMADVYAAVTDRILINLARHFPYVQTNRHIGSWEYQTMMLAQMGKVEKETIAIIAQSLGGADEALKQALETAILQGLKNEEPKLRQAAMKGLLKPNGYVPELDQSQLQAFTSYYRQSADKLNLVNTVMLDSTKQAYQATVADVAQKIANTQGIMNAAAGEVVTGVSTWNGAMHSAVQKMVANGITGFIDHAGHKWSPEAYVAMDIKTTMFNTARAAVWERSEQYGSDLYQVSSHNGARPLCYPWQGKVISTSGRTGITHDLDGNEVVIHSESEIESFRYGGGLFGVNCGHYPMTFIPEFSTLKGEPQDQATNDKQYAETQQQRALERRLREEKRDLEVMKAQGAPAEQIKAQRERVRNASADIDEFCDKTGLPRRRNREAAPVRAEWSTPNGNVTRYDGGYIGMNDVPPPQAIETQHTAKQIVNEPKEVRNTKTVTTQIETEALNFHDYWSEETEGFRRRTIQEATGFDDKKTEEVLHAFSGDRQEYLRLANSGVLDDASRCWFYGADGEIRTGVTDYAKATAKTIDDYITAAPKYGGRIYRGLALDDDVIEQMQTGYIFKENGLLSSWTSKTDAAEMFAYGRAEELGKTPVIIETTNALYSAPVSHLSIYGSEESEVIVSNIHADEYTITGQQMINGILHIFLELGGK